MHYTDKLERALDLGSQMAIELRMIEELAEESGCQAKLISDLLSEWEEFHDCATRYDGPDMQAEIDAIEVSRLPE